MESANFIIISPGFIIGPVTMDKPELSKYSSPSKWMERSSEYRKHIYDLPRYQVEGLFNGKEVGDTVTLLEDFIFRYEVKGRGDKWHKCNMQNYGHYKEGWKRILAIPINPTEDFDRVFSYKKMCPQCKGTGFESTLDGSSQSVCVVCKGTGVDPDREKPYIIAVPSGLSLKGMVNICQHHGVDVKQDDKQPNIFTLSTDDPANFFWLGCNINNDLLNSFRK